MCSCKNISYILSNILDYTNINCCTGWGGHLSRRFCNIFSKSSPCLLGQHGSCSTAQQPGELSENSLQNLRNKWPPYPVFTAANHNTVLVLRMAHRKWIEFKQQPSMFPGSAVPGSCLVSFYFLWAILSTSTVVVTPRCSALNP